MTQREETNSGGEVYVIGQPIQYASYELVKRWHPGVVVEILDGGLRVEGIGADGELRKFPCAWGSVKP